MKCPACKVSNTLDEVLRHPSVTSARAATQAWESFVHGNSADIALAIYPCRKHGSEHGYAAFIQEANRKRDAVIAAARQQQEHQIEKNIRAVFAQAARTLFGGGF